jgi:hypothetical protein
MKYYGVVLSLSILLMSASSAVASQYDSLSGQQVVLQPEVIAASGTHHALYAELLGSGIFYSLNYEYRLNKWIALRGGGGLMTSSADKSYSNLLLMAMFISNNDGHAFEFGAGGVGVRLKDTDGSGSFGMAGALAVGYRFQTIEGGVMFRVTYTPLYYKRISLSDRNITYWRTMVGLSMGFAF